MKVLPAVSLTIAALSTLVNESSAVRQIASPYISGSKGINSHQASGMPSVACHTKILRPCQTGTRLLSTALDSSSNSHPRFRPVSNVEPQWAIYKATAVVARYGRRAQRGGRACHVGSSLQHAHDAGAVFREVGRENLCRTARHSSLARPLSSAPCGVRGRPWT